MYIKNWLQFKLDMKIPLILAITTKNKKAWPCCIKSSTK